MQELIQNFGINWYLFIAQLVNFLIVLYILKRFAFGPLLKMLKDRKATIAESLKNAEKTEKLLADAEIREKEVLKKAQTQAQEIINDAKKEAVEVHNQAEITTKERVERMLVEAQEKINEQTKIAEKQLASQVTRLSVEILEKSLQGFFTDKEQKEVIEKATKRIKA